MNSSANVLDVYKELAECYERRGQAQMRDRFLVLAADAALSGGQADQAERLRLRLLQSNPHHMLKPYATYDQARTAPDVDTYVRNLRLNYPLEVASDLLRALRTSDDPGMQKMEQTLASPQAVPREEPTLRLDVDDEPMAATAWSAAADDSPAKPAPRPRVVTQADVERTEPAPRAAAPRVASAPRSAAPSSVPAPRPLAPTRPPAPKVPPRPAPGPSPFAALPKEPMFPAPAPQAQPEEEELEGSGWLASVLLVLVSLFGLSVVAYIIARPFLP